MRSIDGSITRISTRLSGRVRPVSTRTNTVLRPDSFHLDDRTAMRITGVSILLMAIVGGLAYGLIHMPLHMPGDPSATFKNTTGQSKLIVVAFAAWLLVALLDVVVSMGVYQLYRITHNRLAAITAGLRWGYAATLALAAFVLLNSALDDDAHIVYMGFERFEFIWSVGLLIFGSHLICLGSLAHQSRLTPKPIGWLLIIAGVSYLVTKVGWFAGYVLTDIEPVLAAAMIIGELSFAIWLIVANRKSDTPKKKSNEDSPLTFLEVFQSVLWAAAGIQKHENRVRDFTRGNPIQFILMGVAFTAGFVLALIGIVHVILMNT